MSEIKNESARQTKDTKTEIRVQAVFAMLKGESIKLVAERFGMCRGILYQLRRQVINAIRREIENPKREARSQPVAGGQRKQSSQIVRTVSDSEFLPN